MLIINNTSTDPSRNLLLEENLCSLGVEVFMLWRNSPSVIVGRFQDIAAEVNTEFSEANGIPIVRRNSGGGAVYHDLGNVNYTFIQRDDRRLTLEHFARIIMGTLEAIGINSRLPALLNTVITAFFFITGHCFSTRI